MFYKKGIDITNDKQMFNFLKNHFEYFTMNSWNRLSSVANNVKLHNLNLSGDWCVAYDLLNSGEYCTVNYLINKWEKEHDNRYRIFFNGRSDGYLVLAEAKGNTSLLPDEITESVDYEEYKRYCREFCGSVKANRSDLVYYTKLVQDFDRLCDEIRDFCDRLSMLSFEVTEMESIVETFNDRYEPDLDYLGFDTLSCDGKGKVDISEISDLDCLMEAFIRLADRSNLGYILVTEKDTISLCKN